MFAQAADEGVAALAVDQPVVSEADVDDDVVAGALATAHRPVDNFLIAPIARSVVAQAFGRSSLECHGLAPEILVPSHNERRAHEASLSARSRPPRPSISPTADASGRRRAAARD
jgi:hypothetical protein